MHQRDPAEELGRQARELCCLVKAMRQSHDPVLAVGYYHSHNPVLARYYGHAVLTVYHRLQGIYPRMAGVASAQ